ncbi:hypothetical protein [Phenylobacterium sp.]|uniref:hypothetical protein n=1 Tax=Phenylobacterium sp. TaxID=1871053 RepID=UPI0027192736|nr:hypothetical protein [Phenylobacterium sp.]MDO8380493.1 hypothetical protein [Phenylobacterium sp.]
MPPHDAPDLVDALTTERAVDAARVAWSAREARRGAGVAWSGMAGAALAPAEPTDLLAAARARLAARRAWNESAHGRFVVAVVQAQVAARAAHAAGEQARAAAARDFEAERQACAQAARELRAAALALLRGARAARAALDRDDPAA